MKFRSKSGLFIGLICCLLLICALPVSVLALGDPPSQAGSKVLAGGQRDFAFPVPGHNTLSSCFTDNRRHYALDFPAPKGTPVVASYAGKVIKTYNGCSHNYGKSSSCCSDGFGNYVVLQHDYILKSGEHVTLYSRYSHLTKATVSEGQTVSRGQQVGTMGSTGYSTGHHLDYQILLGGWTPFRNYSIDPYINELLELPEGLHSMNSGGCCSRYVAYVKEYYPRCLHDNFNAEGRCADCGYNFDYTATRSAAAMGIYTVCADIAPANMPYTAALGSATTITAGTEVSVSASVTNGAGESWYQLQSGGYLPKSALTFSRHLDSEFTCQITSITEGQTLKQQSHTLSGTVTSLYPLKKVSGYIDEAFYGSWTGTSSKLELSGTDINNKLYFSALAPGKHTLTITAADTTGREEVTVAQRIFFIEKPPTFYTVILDPTGGACKEKSLSIQENHALGKLPEAEKEGHTFTGWYLESGEAVTEDTAITEAITLSAGWEPKEYTVTLGDFTQTVLYGQTLPQLPEPKTEGYKFLGWFTAEDGGREFTLQSTVSEDITLYPHWEGLQFDVTLDPVGGKVTWHTKTVTFGKNYGAFPTPKWEGYQFMGWQNDNNAITNTTKVTVAKNHTLTAIWEPIETIPAETQAPAKENAATANPQIKFPLWVIPLVLGLLCAIGLLLFLRHRKQNAPAEEAPEEAAEEALVEESPIEETETAIP